MKKEIKRESKKRLGIDSNKLLKMLKLEAR